MLNILFFGSCSFSKISFSSLLNHSSGNFNIQVVSNSEKSELSKTANDLKIPSHLTPPKTLKNWSLPEGSFDIGIVSSFGYFIPQRIINSFKLGMINIHPSLLPRHRGPSPIQYTILEGDTETGVSIIDLHPGIIDAGNILIQSKLDATLDSLMYKELESLLAEEGGSLTAKILPTFTDYWNQRRQQVEEEDSLLKTSQTKKIYREDGRIEFSKMTKTEIVRKIRALSHQVSIHSFVNDRVIIFEDFILSNDDSPSFPAAKPGAVYLDKPRDILYVRCALDKEAGEDHWIGFKKFKIIGKSCCFGAKEFFGNARLENLRLFFQ